MNGDIPPTESQTVRRIMPQSGLDFNMMLTDTMWGSPNISKQLKEKMRQRAERGGQGQDDQEKEAAWELLSFYTRDFRLGNLDRLYGDLDTCQHYTDLAADLVREGMSDSFATSLGRTVTILELSQSKSGFLRKRQNTLTTESLQGEIDPQKKKLISFGRKQG